MCFTNLLLWFAVPVHDHLFNASVCHSKKERGRNFEGIGQPGNPGALDAVDPVVMPSLSASPNSAKLDTVFLLSNGRLTSLSPTGERLWQTQTSAIWRKQHTTLSTMANHEAGLRTDSVIVPSLRYVNLHAEKSWEEADADDLQLLAVGDANLCLVASDGRVRATMSLPNQPVGAPMLGDFNDDGVVDIVVPTAVAFHGFAVERRANVGGALFTALVAILLIILAVVWVVNFVDFEMGDDTFSTAGRGIVSHILQLCPRLYSNFFIDPHWQ